MCLIDKHSLFPICALVSLAILSPFSVFAQNALPTPTYYCVKINEPVTIDGRLNEPAWEKAEGVVLNKADSGRPAKYKTVAKLVWDNTFLYVSFYCEDPDVWNTMAKHDDHLWDQEVVEFFVYAGDNKYQYFEFEVSPTNALVDLFVLNYREKFIKGLFDWDSPNIQHAVQVNGTLNKRDDLDQSWTCEMAYPLDELWTGMEVPPKDGDVWHMNLYRIDRGKTETSDEYQSWSPIGMVNFHRPSRFGNLIFKTN